MRTDDLDTTDPTLPTEGRNHELVGEPRSGGPTSEPTNPTSGSPIGDAKGRVELERMSEFFKYSAAKSEDFLKSPSGRTASIEEQNLHLDNAAQSNQWAMILNAILDAEPRPQSERSEDAPEAALAFKIRHLKDKAVEHDRYATKAMAQGLSHKHAKTVRHRTTATICQQIAADLETMLP